MSQNTESYFLRLLTDCRKAIVQSRGGFFARVRQRLQPEIIDQTIDQKLQPHYQTLADYGQVVWGAITQVNMFMFTRAEGDLPGVTTYSDDPHFDTHPQDLLDIAHACFEFKNTIPVDKDFAKLALRITDEFDQTARMIVPPKLTNDRKVFMGATRFHRIRLPNDYVECSVFPIVIAPKKTDLNMILPLPFWPADLRREWGTLFNETLKSAQITNSVKGIAASIEKHPLSSKERYWDTTTTPVYITKVMAEQFRTLDREHGLDGTGLLAISLSDSGVRTADLVRAHYPETESVFESNGVKVAIRNDQLELLRGSLVHFVDTSFETGIVIYLPHESATFGDLLSR